MSFASPVLAAIGRLLSGYNGRAFDPDVNPLGLPRGGNRRNVINADGNFVALGRDAATVGQGIAAVAGEVGETADRFEAAVAAIEAGPVTSVNGMSGVVVLPDVPKVLPPIVTQPVAGSTPSLTGGALVLSVDRLTSLYGEAQKTIRFQVSTVSTFATTVYDSGVLTQAAVSASLANAQAVLTGGTTYYVRAIQTDAKDVSSGWSAPVSFVFPRLPNAPVMSAPANNAMNVGAQNAPITLTAGAYSHPNGTAQSVRRFELSKDNFATIVTVNGTAGQASATISSPKDVLTANTAWKVRCVDTDANGGSATSAATTFTTTAVYRANPGDADSGGIKAFNDFGDGLLVDLVAAPKSTEISRQWGNGGNSTQVGSLSRLNGPDNTSKSIAVGGTVDNSAQAYARSVSIGGASGHLAALDELLAIKSKASAFPAAEAFSNAYYWSSTEYITSDAYMGAPNPGSTPAISTGAKTTAYPVRAIKRIAASMPYPIGTAMEGGYLAAYFTDCSVSPPTTYMLIVADKATEVGRAWAATVSTTGGGSESRTNGLTPTNALNGSTNYPAFKYCFDLVSGGKDDWYLPAVDEFLSMLRMNASLPAAQRFSNALGTDGYWTSSELSGGNARFVNWSTVAESDGTKGTNFVVRAARRVPLPA